MKTWIGKSIVVIGIIHTVFGLVVFRGIFETLFSEGLFNTVNQQPDREAAFWFLFSGFALLIIGVLVNWIERTLTTFPLCISWSFLILTLAGVFIMPISGFWLLLVPAVGLLVRMARSRQTKSA